jgi:hypothetical protein
VQKEQNSESQAPPVARRRSPFEATWRRHRRAEAALLRRCRAGDLDALTAIAYALADDVWAAACLRQARQGPAPPDAATAPEEAAEALIHALRRLEGWTTPSLAELRAAALAALGVVPAEVEQKPATAPPEVILRLAQAARQRSSALVEASRRRAFWHVQGYAVVGALVLSIAVILVSYQAMSRIGRVPPVLLEGLQFRVRHSGLATTMRDIAWELPDPTGADRPIANALEEAALILDEIAALSPAQARERLPFTAARIARTGMVYALQAAIEQGIGPKTALLDVCLVLQEVENCFGPGGVR